jgi:hypothetical protein
MIVDKLSEAILRGEFLKKDTILVDVRDVTDDKGVTEKQIVIEKAPVAAMASSN